MRLLALAMGVALSLFAQDPRATVRVEVTAVARPVDKDSVTVNGALTTGPDGVATAPVPLGRLAGGKGGRGNGGVRLIL